MSLEGTDRYQSPYEAMKRERDYVNIFLPRDVREPEPSPGHCPIHNARYVDYSSGSNDMRCPICGYKKPVEVAVAEEKPKEEQQQQQKIKKKNPVKGKKTFAMSQNTRDNKKAKSPGQIEIEKELGGRSEVSSYEEWDL
jgi:uncharacterized Zn finger protein (UPF0148 family)